MGKTTTPNLALIKPDTDESIKQNLPTFDGWAVQNAANCDTLDALFRTTSSTYAPALSATAAPTFGGGGFIEGKYLRLWPRMVFVFFRVYMGNSTGFTAGTGSYRISLPFNMDATIKANDPTRSIPIGRALFKDNSAAVTSGSMICLYDPTNNNVAFGKSNGGLFGNSDVGADDRFNGYLMYPTSDP